MANGLKKYNLGCARLRAGVMEGLTLEQDGTLRTAPDAEQHAVFLHSLDGGQDDCPWGRLVFEVEMPEHMVLVTHAFASNESRIIQNDQVTEIDDFLLDPTRPAPRKRRLFEMADGIRAVGVHDILLDGQQGRYLWLAFELLGTGEAWLRNFRVYTPGDVFFHTFPEVYRTNGEFFHRYLSVFSTLYTDFQEKIDRLPEMIDIDTAPVALLPVFADWLGLGLDGNFLSEAQMRRLLHAAFRLACLKGTRQAIAEVVQVLIDEPATLVERRQLEDGSDPDGLYGDSPFCFTVLVPREADERLHAQLLFLINQFKPMRSRVSIIFLGDTGRVDDYCYLDVNATLVQASAGQLDDGAALSGRVCLTE